MNYLSVLIIVREGFQDDRNRKLALLVRVPCTAANTMSLNSFTAHSLGFDHGMIAEPFHVRAELGSSLSELHNLFHI